jgi:hypothetical protein
MKIPRITLSVFTGLVTILGLQAAPKAPPRAEVTFSEPDKFSDAADDQRGSDFGREANLSELKSYIEDRANVYVPEGQKLQVTITDVDLAGEIEPWRSSSLRDARIVKDIYPPRIQLNFKLTDATGAVVKEGTRNLTDLAFLMNIYPNRSEQRVYEKALLDNWLRSDFGGKKKK